MHAPDITHDNLRLGAGASRAGSVALLAGAVLVGAALVLGWKLAAPAEAHASGPVADAELHGWAAVLRAYLVAFCFVTTLCLGGLFFTLVQHATKAGWGVVARRLAEALASNLRWLWIGFIPIALGMWFSEETHLYEWAIPSVMAGDPVLQPKKPFLNPEFWLIRSAVYFLVWGSIAHWFLKTSTQQDSTGNPELTLRMQGRSYVSLILFAITLTGASVDWIMSLEPHWFSTMFGVYFFAGSCCGAFATLIIMAWLLQRSGRIEHAITTEHYHDLGKGLFAFGIVFWAYIAFSQYMLIWYAGLPEETMWFMPRQLGGWRVVSCLLIFGHFAGPFVLIISRHMKRARGIITLAAVWMLFIHFVDLYWLIMPRVPSDILARATSYAALKQQFSQLSIGFNPVVHLTSLAGLVCLLVAGTVLAFRSRSLIPERDPRLAESLAFENA